jgi:hypothetical protein
LTRNRVKFVQTQCEGTRARHLSSQFEPQISTIMRQHPLQLDRTDGTSRPTADLTARTTTLRDHSETVLDVLIVALILALLSSFALFSVGGLRTVTAEPACDGNVRTLGAAAEVFFAQHGSAAIPATGTGHDRYEQTLVDLGLIRAASDLYDLDADGAVRPEGDSPC